MSNVSIGTGTYLVVYADDEATTEVVRRAIVGVGGNEVGVHSRGGNVFVFARASDALSAGAAVRRAMRGGFRVGAHTGESVAEAGELFGADVTVAAQLGAAAADGHMLVSGVTAALASASLSGCALVDRGSIRLSEFAVPQQVLGLILEGERDDDAPVPKQPQAAQASAVLEIWSSDGASLSALDQPRMTIGKAAMNDIAITDDATVSRVHAVVEEISQIWSIRDMSSRNGTFVNGERIVTARPLKRGDEIRVGQTRLVFRPATSVEATETAAIGGLPSLTRREQDVLDALCRPMASGASFRTPASTRQIADELFVSVDAVKQHLANLYAKFGLYDGRDRRVQLANAVIERGAVNLADLARKPEA